jgi:uncharacterized membrane protein YvlD (DUF360 family)
MLVGALFPGVSSITFGTAIIAALVISLLGWAMQSLFGARVSPQGRGLMGFIVGAVVIYLTALIVPGFRVSIWGALIASLVIGLVDMVIPTTIR